MRIFQNESSHSLDRQKVKQKVKSLQRITLLQLVMTVLSIVAVYVVQASDLPKETAHPELDMLKEETVSISARHEQPISEAASNVYVITDEDILHSGAIDLPTLLRRIPGIEVMQLTGADFNVSARGGNQLPANKMLVLVDGRSIYEDAIGQVFWKTIPITLPEIKRIEVLKGPASALYGFNAFDGVINIITKSPEEMKANTNGTITQFGGGEFGTVVASAIQAGTYDKFGYRLSVGRDQTNKWNDRDALAFRAHKFNALLEYSLTDDAKLKVAGGVVDANSYDAEVTDPLHEKTKQTQGYAQAAYERPNFFIRGWWTEFSQTSLELASPLISPFFQVRGKNGSQTQPFLRDTYDIESQHILNLGSANRLTYGVEYRNNFSTSNFLDTSSKEQRVGLYFQDEAKLDKDLIAVVGLRLDLHSEVNPTYSPRIALIYKVSENQTVRVAGSAAARPPTIFERHIESNIVVFGFPVGTFLGSKNLTPEKIASYEAGYQGWFLRHRLRLRGDLFYNHVSDLITLDPTGTASTNVGKADIYGGEAGIEFLAASWLTGFANYSYQKTWQSSDLIGTTAQRSGPPYKVNAGVRGEWDNGLSGEATVHHVAAATYPISGTFGAFGVFLDNRVGSYTLLNLRGAYQFWKEKAEVAVTVFNALNDRHQEHPFGDTIGSRVMGWLTIKY